MRLEMLGNNAFWFGEQGHLWVLATEEPRQN